MANRHQVGSVRLKSKTWFGRYRKDLPDRRQQVSVILGYRPEMRKTDAKNKLQQLLVAEGINQPDYLDKVTKPVTTFNDVADLWVTKRLPDLAETSRNTMPLRLRKFTRPFFGTMPLETIRTAQVNDWIRGLTAAGLKPKSVMNVYKDFRAIFNWHRQEQDQPKVTWYAKLPKLLNIPPRWFTPAEVDMLVNSASGQYKTFFRLAGFSGLRFGELAGLRYEDIDFNRGVLQVKRSSPYSETTKTPAGFYRTVYLDAVTLEMIRQHLAGRTSGRVFETKFGTPLKSTDVNRHVLKPLCAALGIPKGTCHSFRHSRISVMVAARLPEKFIQSQVGQVDKKVTAHYTHFEDETNHEFINEALLRGQKGFRGQNSQAVN